MWICVYSDGKPLHNAYGQVLIFNDIDTARKFALKSAATVKLCYRVRKGAKA